MNAASDGASMDGKTVLVTGGTTGIGRAIAIDLARRGARLLVFGRHQAELDDALADIRKGDPEAGGLTADASDPDDVARVWERVDREFGELDILVDNAAIGGEGLADMEDHDWRYVIETNITGYLAFAKEAATRMQKRKSGHILIIGSISADSRSADSSVYVASKAAIQGFAESFSKELAPDNIRVSLIEPGTVGSDIREETVQEQRKRIAKHEMLMAEDIAACAAYVLAQPERCNVAAVRIIPRLQD